MRIIIKVHKTIKPFVLISQIINTMLIDTPTIISSIHTNLHDFITIKRQTWFNKNFKWSSFGIC